jgi:hypothetical protein
MIIPLLIINHAFPVCIYIQKGSLCSLASRFSKLAEKISLEEGLCEAELDGNLPLLADESDKIRLKDARIHFNLLTDFLHEKSTGFSRECRKKLSFLLSSPLEITK